MYARTELSLGKFIDQTAQAELRDLERLGGRPLRTLAREIYMAFGLTPGEDKKIAERLKSLPMHVDRRLPTFTYIHWGKRGLIEHTGRRYNRTIGFTVWGNDSAQGYSAISPARTPTIERFVDGAAAMHTKLGHSIGRGGLYLHVLSTVVNTGNAKGLKW